MAFTNAAYLVGAPGVGARSTTSPVTGTYCQPPAANNLLVAVVCFGSTTSAVPACAQNTGTTGWTQQKIQGNNNALTSFAGIAVFTKVAAGGDAAPQFTFSGTGTLAGQCTIFELFNPNATPVDVSGVYASGSTAGTIASLNGLLTTVGNIAAAGEFGIACWCFAPTVANTVTWTKGGAYLHAYDDGATSSRTHMSIDYIVSPGAGATLSENCSITSMTAYGCGIIIAFKQAASVSYPLGQISAVANPAVATGTALASLAIGTAQNIGDLLVVHTKIGSSTITCTGISDSSGFTAGWTRVAGPFTDNQPTSHTQDIWIGTVTAAGATTLNFTYSAAVTGLGIDLDCQEFTVGHPNVTWARDGTQQGNQNNAAATTHSWPSLTAAGAGELWVGTSRIPAGGYYSTTQAGLVVARDANSNAFVYNTSTPSGASAFAIIDTLSVISSNLDVLIIATPTQVTAAASQSVTAARSAAATTSKPMVNAAAPLVTATGTAAATRTRTAAGARPVTATATAAMAVTRLASGARPITATATATAVKTTAGTIAAVATVTAARTAAATVPRQVTAARPVTAARSAAVTGTRPAGGARPVTAAAAAAARLAKPDTAASLVTATITATAVKTGVDQIAAVASVTAHATASLALSRVVGASLTVTHAPSTSSQLAKPVGASLTVHTLGLVAEAVGNPLIVSLASAAGVDDYGNAFPRGIQALEGEIHGSTLLPGTVPGTVLEADTVIAGVVDGTTIEGAQFVADGSAGEILVYPSTPASGNLIGSWSGAAGTDASSNPYPLGLMAQAVTLPYQGGVPATVPTSTVFFANGVGHAQTVDPSGLVRNVPKSTSQATGPTIGNTATQGGLYTGSFRTSADLGVGDEIKIHSPFNVQMGQTTAEIFNIYYSFDGGTPIRIATIGAAIVATSGTYSGHFDLCLKVITTGTGGSIQVWLEGAVGAPVNIGFGGTSAPICGTVLPAVAFDTTVLHTVMLYGQWGGTGGSLQAFSMMGATYTAY